LPEISRLKDIIGERGEGEEASDNGSDVTNLPSIILSNVRSLRNKMDELRLNRRYCHEYRLD